MSEFDLEDIIADVRKSAKRAVDGHKHSFLHRFMENTESEISQLERDKDLLKMPMNLRKHPADMPKQ